MRTLGPHHQPPLTTSFFSPSRTFIIVAPVAVFGGGVEHEPRRARLIHARRATVVALNVGRARGVVRVGVQAVGFAGAEGGDAGRGGRRAGGGFGCRGVGGGVGG